MKPSIQLRLGQHLTMTPQLQQAIRLLQLSTLDLKQEIQDALESNLMLEQEEDTIQDQSLEKEKQSLEESSEGLAVDTDNEQEINAESEVIPSELPVDTQWDDQYDMPLSRSSSGNAEHHDFLDQQSTEQSLQDYLLWQLNLTPFSDIDRAIATAIIDGISPDGYLQSPLEEIVTDIDDPETGLEEVTAVLHRVQRFDPPGIAARNPQECLLLQVEQLQDDPLAKAAKKLLNDHFDLLVSADENRLCRILKLSGDEVRQVIQLIRSLNPRPGATVSPASTTYVEPDVFVHKQNGRWIVTLNPDTTPRLRINPDYAMLVKRADTSADNLTLKDHLQEARWFIKSLQSRSETLLRVASKIVEYQQNFFEYGEEAMKPLVLKDIAEALDLHESTISRVTTQKYMHTPRGILEFKYFFSSQLGTTSGDNTSATAIRALIRKMISAEKPQKPLSDNKIATLLSDEGIKVARRTVAKYRETMAIPPSNERKRLI